MAIVAMIWMPVDWYCCCADSHGDAGAVLHGAVLQAASTSGDQELLALLIAIRDEVLHQVALRLPPAAR